MRRFVLVVALAAGLPASITSQAGAQTISWSAPISGNWNDALNWSPMNVPDVDTEDAVIAVPGTYTISMTTSRTIGSFEISNADATVEIRNLASLRFSLDSTNDGTIVVHDGGAGNNITRLDVLESVSLSGAGEVFLAKAAVAELRIDSGATLTHAQSHTIRGTGDINGGTLINNGSVIGVLGGVLRIEGCAVDQSGGGTIEPGQGIIEFSSASSVSAGRVGSTAHAGVVRIADFNNTFFDDVLVEGDVLLENGATLNITAGGLVNNGLITVHDATASSNTTRFDVLESLTLDGVGDVRLNKVDVAHLRIDSAATLVNTATHTISGTGQILNGSLDNRGQILGIAGGRLSVNNCVVDQTSGGIIDPREGEIEFRSGSIVTGGQVGNVGSTGLATIRAFNGTTFDGVHVASDVLIRNAGTLAVTAGGLVNNATITVHDSSGSNITRLDVLESSTFSGSGAIMLNAAGIAELRILNSSTLTLAAGHTIEGTGDILNGVLTNNSAVLGVQDGILAFIGCTVQQSPAGFIGPRDGVVAFASGASVTGGRIGGPANGGTVRVSAFNSATIDDLSIEGDVVIENGATLNVSAGTITNDGTITVHDGIGSNNLTRLDINEPTLLAGSGDIVLNNEIAAGLRILSGSTLTHGQAHTIKGSGDIINGTLINEGVLEPGIDGIGAIHLATTTLDLGPTSVMSVQIGGTDPGQYDRFTMSASSVELGGTLVIDFVDGFVPQVGDEFVLVGGGGSVTGSFDDVIVEGDSQRFRLIEGPDEVAVRYTCLTDINGDFLLNNTDINAFISGFLNQGPLADINNDGLWNNTDINLFVQLFLGGCV